MIVVRISHIAPSDKRCNLSTNDLSQCVVFLAGIYTNEATLQSKYIGLRIVKDKRKLKCTWLFFFSLMLSITYSFSLRMISLKDALLS